MMYKDCVLWIVQKRGDTNSLQFRCFNIEFEEFSSSIRLLIKEIYCDFC